jgi:hypothetical protein
MSKNNVNAISPTAPRRGRPPEPNSRRSVKRREREADRRRRALEEKAASAFERIAPPPSKVSAAEAAEPMPAAPPDAPAEAKAEEARPPEPVKSEPVPPAPPVDDERLKKLKAMVDMAVATISTNMIDGSRFKRGLGPMPSEYREAVGGLYVLCLELYLPAWLNGKYAPLLAAGGITLMALTVPSTKEDQERFDREREKMARVAAATMAARQAKAREKAAQAAPPPPAPPAPDLATPADFGPPAAAYADPSGSVEDDAI